MLGAGVLIVRRGGHGGDCSARARAADRGVPAGRAAGRAVRQEAGRAAGEHQRHGGARPHHLRRALQVQHADQRAGGGVQLVVRRRALARQPAHARPTQTAPQRIHALRLAGDAEHVLRHPRVDLDHALARIDQPLGEGDSAQRQAHHRRQQRRERPVAGGRTGAIRGAHDAVPGAGARGIGAAAPLGQAERRVDGDQRGAEARHRRLDLLVRARRLQEAEPAVAAEHRQPRRVARAAAQIDAERERRRAVLIGRAL